MKERDFTSAVSALPVLCAGAALVAIGGTLLSVWPSLMTGFLIVLAGGTPFVLLMPMYDSAERRSDEHADERWIVMLLMTVLSAIALAVASQLIS